MAFHRPHGAAGLAAAADDLGRAGDEREHLAHGLGGGGHEAARHAAAVQVLDDELGLLLALGQKILVHGGPPSRGRDGVRDFRPLHLLSGAVNAHP